NDSYDAVTRTIHWDPYSALRTTSGGTQSPALGLGHEADHAIVNAGRAAPGWNTRVRAYDDLEEQRVIRGSEAHAARTLGESARHNHRGSTYRVASPIDR
ncbi:MAG: protein rhsD, partial [Candidatus Eremiobacteraeota bacterium]|nr:protein rhsD [Candidatus Eremiobacteraeota bacterium]